MPVYILEISYTLCKNAELELSYIVTVSLYRSPETPLLYGDISSKVFNVVCIEFIIILPPEESKLISPPEALILIKPLVEMVVLS